VGEHNAAILAELGFDEAFITRIAGAQPHARNGRMQ
jgi:hypothetical protein